VASKFKFNPFTGYFDMVEDLNSLGSVENVVLKDMICETTALTGELVKEDPSVNNKVLEIVDNVPANLPTGVFGVIISKSSPTLCNVMLFGTVVVLSGLTPGTEIFLHTDGTITHTPPVTGLLQKLGRALTTTKAFWDLGPKVIR